jgi:hypothetical protein
MTAKLSELGISAFEHAGNFAVAHHGDAVADIQNFLHVAADHQDHRAGFGRRFVVRADVGNAFARSRVAVATDQKRLGGYFV